MIAAVRRGAELVSVHTLITAQPGTGGPASPAQPSPAQPSPAQPAQEGGEAGSRTLAPNFYGKGELETVLLLSTFEFR